MIEQFRLDGKVAIVTGAAQGLGASIAEGFAEAGCRVALADIQDAGELAKKITRQTGQETASFKTDVSSEEEICLLVEEIEKRFGQIDILVNNAGLCSRILVATEDIDLDEHWWPQINVNLTGPVICTREVSRRMIKKGIAGSIINTSSVSGIRPSCYVMMQGYNAAKAGLINLTRAWALELARFGIRVNTVAPGLFRTGMTEMIFDDRKNYLKIPLDRGAEPEEIKGTYIFLASGAASYITGAVITVDGGATAGFEYNKDWVGLLEMSQELVRRLREFENGGNS